MQVTSGSLNILQQYLELWSDPSLTSCTLVVCGLFAASRSGKGVSNAALLKGDL